MHDARRATVADHHRAHSTTVQMDLAPSALVAPIAQLRWSRRCPVDEAGAPDAANVDIDALATADVDGIG